MSFFDMDSETQTELKFMEGNKFIERVRVKQGNEGLADVYAKKYA